MEDNTKEFYNEERRKKRYDKQLFFFGPNVSYSFEDLILNLIKAKTEYEGKEDVELWIDASNYDEFGECYVMVSWKDWETEEDFERRMWEKKRFKERSIESLKRLIDNNPQETVEYIKQKKLI